MTVLFNDDDPTHTQCSRCCFCHISRETHQYRHYSSDSVQCFPQGKYLIARFASAKYCFVQTVVDSHPVHRRYREANWLSLGVERSVCDDRVRSQSRV